MAMTKKKQDELVKKGYEYILFNDTETTGVKEHDRVIQTGHALYLFKDGDMQFVEYLEENLAVPEGVEIGPKAASIHGLWYADFEGCPSFEESKSKKRYLELIEKGAYIVQHNGIAFDLPMLEKDGIVWPKDKVIDTMIIARHYNQTRDDFEIMREKDVGAGLQAMRFYFDFDRNPKFKKFMKAYGISHIVPHTALADILVLAFYFEEILVGNKVITSLEEAARLSRQPVIQKTVEWGNQVERGSLYSDVIGGTYFQYGREKQVVDYFDWAFNKMANMDAAVKLSIATAVFDAVLDRKININHKFSNGSTMDDYINFATAFNSEVYKKVVERYNENPSKKSPEDRIKAGLDFAKKRMNEAKEAEDERQYESFKTLIENREVFI